MWIKQVIDNYISSSNEPAITWSYSISNFLLTKNKVTRSDLFFLCCSINALDCERSITNHDRSILFVQMWTRTGLFKMSHWNIYKDCIHLKQDLKKLLNFFVHIIFPFQISLTRWCLYSDHRSFLWLVNFNYIINTLFYFST